MSENDKQQMVDTIRATIKETVNGKIDSLSGKLDAHISAHEKDSINADLFYKKVELLMEAKSNFAFLYKSVLGIGSIAAAWLAIRSALGK